MEVVSRKCAIAALSACAGEIVVLGGWVGMSRRSARGTMRVIACNLGVVVVVVDVCANGVVCKDKRECGLDTRIVGVGSVVALELGGMEVGIVYNIYYKWGLSS